MNLSGQETRTASRSAWAKPAMLAIALAGFAAAIISMPSFAAMFTSPSACLDVQIHEGSYYEYREGRFSAKIIAPQLSGLADEDAQEQLNRELLQDAAQKKQAFERDIEEIKGRLDDKVSFSVESGYTIKTDNEKILAIDVYTLNIAGSSNTTHKFYTFDRVAGSLLALSDLFMKDADYATVLSDYIKGEMLRRNAEENGLFWIDGSEAFAAISPEQSFYISDGGNIVICFNRHEVAAGAQGSPEFQIPEALVRDILK